jgi:hypothetical protein
VSFEWIPPPSEQSHIAISPLVSTLAAGESGRVEIAFTPKPMGDPTGGEEKDVPPHVGSVMISQAVKSSEPWSAHASWTVPCFLARSGSKPGSGTPKTCFALLFTSQCLCASVGDVPVTLNDALALEIHTTITQTALRLDQNKLSFGQVAVGTTQLSKVCLLAWRL